MSLISFRSTPFSGVQQASSMVELFSGSAVMASQFEGCGQNTACLDKLYGNGMDINKPSGFGCHLELICVGCV